jgi:hypothetical protein
LAEDPKLCPYILNSYFGETMITWALILFAHVGPFGDGNSNALTSLPGFATKQECASAGVLAATMSEGSTKVIKYVCVQQTRP